MKVLYISQSKLENSVNSVYIKGLEQNDVEIVKFYSSKKGIRAYIEAYSFLRKEQKWSDVIIIGYDSPGFVVVAKLFSDKKIVYNALCSVYERLIVSRNLASRVSFRAFSYWLLDFLAVHFADLVMLETNHQIEYFKKLFLVSGKNLFRAWTGVDEDKFYYADVVKNNVFTAVFRGALMPEAGADWVVRAAKILEDQPIEFIMVSNGMELQKITNLIEELKPRNLKFITNLLSQDDLRILVQKSHISIGQLSNHDRLNRTIPHKCYESLAMRLPYLTANNKGVMELLTDKETCLTCNPADPESLVQKIIWAKNNPDALNKIAENGYRLFKTKLTPKILAAELMDKILI